MIQLAPKTVTLREESNRTFLLDKNQPQKSIWSIGSIRHNVHSKELADQFSHQANSNNVVRMMEWKEQPKIQPVDKPVAAKIGSYHHATN